MNTIDLTRYDDAHLKDLINRAWDIIFVLSHGVDKPLGSLDIDIVEILNKYMINAAQILRSRENEN